MFSPQKPPRSTEVGGSSFRFSFGLLLAKGILRVTAH